ncbi:MAG: phosphoribosylglycinamide formyltransferase [Clostridia bacterium]|nr:phosphoribosylglycinamide formyltransferase [Clostridia bacterium]
MKKIKTAVLVSGGGTNLQAILDAEKSGIIKSCKISLVISNVKGAFALTRAENAGVRALCFTKKECGGQAGFEARLTRELESAGIELIVLAGFMSILSADFTAKYPRRIINVHPSLIPAFCGKGFYGLRVHEAALSKGVKVTGATVHYVNEIPDGGEIIEQKAVRVYKTDTPEKLQKRVMKQAEHIILPRAVEAVGKELLTTK